MHKLHSPNKLRAYYLLKTLFQFQLFEPKGLLSIWYHSLEQNLEKGQTYARWAGSCWTHFKIHKEFHQNFGIVYWIILSCTNLLPWNMILFYLICALFWNMVHIFTKERVQWAWDRAKYGGRRREGEGENHTGRIEDAL